MADPKVKKLHLIAELVKSVNGITPDETGNVAINIPNEVPDNPTANQQLVTDADGNIKWEDRTHYRSGLITATLNSSNAFVSENGEYGRYGEEPYNSVDPETKATWGKIENDIWVHFNEIWAGNSERRPLVFYWDGVRFETPPVFRLPFIYNGLENGLPYMQFFQSGQTAKIRIGYNEPGEHTLSYEARDYRLKQLDEDFIPDTIARKTDIPDAIINPSTASVGQTITVKSVDENGKPTEWETSSILSELEARGYIKVIQFMDGTSFGMSLQCNMTPEEIIANITADGCLAVYRRIYLYEHDPFDVYTSNVSNAIAADGGNRARKIDFNDGSAPIIVDASNNTITLDPDWVAPAEVALKSEVTGSRITSLDDTQLAGYMTFEAAGIPVYVSDVSKYATYAITETGWYLFVRIAAKTGVVVGTGTTVTGAAGYIATPGVAYIDVAVRFDVAAQSQTVTVTWASGNAETFVFKATDLAVRNLDYRTTFYVYDIADYATWTYTAATGTAVEGTAYFEESNGVYTQVTVAAGEAVSGLYVHSGVTFEGMVRNVTYKCDTVIDCPMTFILPEIEDDIHGCWFEIRFRHSGAYSSTLQVPDGVKVATEHTQAEKAGINMVNLHYTDVGGVKVWRFMNTHSTIPA